LNYKKYISSLVGFAFLLLPFMAQSQDLHFTQYNNAPLLINPANTGFSNFYDYRLGINNRTQWAATNVPYKTFSAWGDAQIMKKKLDNSWLGVGAILLSDVAGTGNLTSTKAFANVAYHQMLNDNSLLSIGISGGWVQKKIDYTKLTFDAQWNDKFFDIDLPSKEVFLNNGTASYIDLNAGINYSWYATDNFYFNGGVSVMHINQPAETFFSPSIVSPNLSLRYNAFLNATIKVNDLLIVSPLAYYSKMSSSQETVLGFNAQYNLSGEGGKTQLLFGGYYRNKNAIAPTFGFQIGNMQLMVNYDATTSTLSNYNAFKNAYEISIVWNGLYGGLDNGIKAVRCSSPKF
jgi:type IX secretion system PorP/SprF family membrane protein